MKFLKISLLASLLISTSAIAQQFAATGIHAGFGVNSVNPVATFQNVSKYMESADFKKLGITAGLYANNVNELTIQLTLSSFIILMLSLIKKLLIWLPPLLQWLIY